MEKDVSIYFYFSILIQYTNYQGKSVEYSVLMKDSIKIKSRNIL